MNLRFCIHFVLQVTIMKYVTPGSDQRDFIVKDKREKKFSIMGGASSRYARVNKLPRNKQCDDLIY